MEAKDTVLQPHEVDIYEDGKRAGIKEYGYGIFIRERDWQVQLKECDIE